MAFTFKDFLVEFTTDTEALSDPEMRADIMRRMRADGDRAERMDDRMQRKAVRDRRSAISDEKDPRRKSLLRQKMMFQQKLDRINDELAASGDAENEPA